MASKDTFTAEVPKDIVEDQAYKDWALDLDQTPLTKVEAAISTVKTNGVINNAKALGDGLYERKWNDGLRLYFAVVEKEGRKTLLLLGSGKNNQQQAIDECKKNLTKYSVVKENLKKKD